MGHTQKRYFLKKGAPWQLRNSGFNIQHLFKILLLTMFVFIEERKKERQCILFWA
jgi:hypothetical protein